MGRGEIRGYEVVSKHSKCNHTCGFSFFLGSLPEKRKALVGISQTLMRNGGIRYGEQETAHRSSLPGDGGGTGEQKMAQLPTQRIGAYLRKMAIDGYIIYTDTADIKAFTKELSAIGRNINQIAKRINAGGPAYQADMDEIRERLDEIWQLQRHILSSQR